MKTPVIRISELAKKAIQDAAAGAGEDAGGDLLKLTISPRFEVRVVDHIVAREYPFLRHAQHGEVRQMRPAPHKSGGEEPDNSPLYTFL